MRVAFVVAPFDPRSSDAGTWSDGIAWLGLALSRAGFRVTVVGEGEDVGAELAQALAGLTADDTVLVHVAGRLARRGVLRVAEGRWMPLRSLGEALAGHAAGDVSIVAELLHEDDAEDALVAADHVASIVSALGARERGYGMLAAVRPSSAPVEGLAFSRLFFEAAATTGGGAPMSAVYDRVRAMPESATVAQSFTLVRGRIDLELAEPAPPSADLDAQIEAATEAGDFARAVALRRERLASQTSPQERVKELVAIARATAQGLGDAEGAVAALEEARAIEPQRTATLQALKRGYEVIERWASAMEVTGALAKLTAAPVDRAALRFAQACMAFEHLQDEDGAAMLLEQVLEDDPTNAEAVGMLSRLRSTLTPPEPIPVPRTESVVTQPPPAARGETGEGDELDPAVYAASFEENQRAGRTDAAFLDALALEELGAAEVEHQMLIEQFRVVTPVRARGTLDTAGWDLLRPEGMDEILTALFAAVARAGVLARVDQLAARGRLVPLDPTTRLDEASTASVVRGFQWAARVLGVACPELYVVPEVPGEIAAVRAPSASTAVGPSVVSGRSAKDLAFLAGRHLTYYRAEHQVLVYFPTREELTRLLLASVQLAKPGVEPTGEGARAVAALAARLDRSVNDLERDELRRAVWELEVRGGKFSLGAWTRNVELMAARAGLLLSGDLATAMAIVNNESRAIAGLSLDTKRRDLLAFCASSEHAELRRRFAVAAPESVRPPPPAGQPAYTA